MLVFWKERLVLLSVPKTGTHAYQKALGPRASMVVSDPPDLKHAPVYRYNRFFRPMFEKMGADDMELVAVIREPISWLGSWYRYRSRPELDGRPNSTRAISFDQFVEGYLQDPRPPFANVGSPRKFVSNGQGNVAVKHLFQYEQIDLAAGFLEDRLKTPVTLAQANVSPKKDMTLDPGTEARLRGACAAEFDLWHSAKRRV